MKTFLRMGTDCLSAVEEHPSISEACAAFFIILALLLAPNL